MTTFCKGEHCPVRNQCQRYKESQVNPVFEGDELISHCRNQRLFTKEEIKPSGRFSGISQETAEELADAIKALADFDPVPQFIKSFKDHMKSKMADEYLSIAKEFVDASYNACTKSIFTRWWWKRKAVKLSKQMDGVMEAIAILSKEKGGEYDRQRENKKRN